MPPAPRRRAPRWGHCGPRRSLCSRACSRASGRRPRAATILGPRIRSRCASPLSQHPPAHHL
eukprot:3327784-Pyramimonas_sp.AAC.1